MILRMVSLIIIFCLCGCITSCGQSGKLYLPPNATTGIAPKPLSPTPNKALNSTPNTTAPTAVTTNHG